MSTQSDTKAQPRDDVPLVAIGASAGGLEPLEALFNAVPDSSGVAFVVIQHLSPDYRSMMNELLGRKSNMRIVHIEDEMELAPDTVFLNRPNMFVELRGGVFRTSPYKEGDGLPHLPIDRLLLSLTSRDPSRTIAIILSGSGSDGAQGTQILHQAGAAVLVQSIQEATFTSMPRAVLMSGAVDRVLGAAEMPRVIQDIFTYGKKVSSNEEEVYDSSIKSVLKKLEQRHRVDFSNYKPTNVNRRIVRRQHLRGHGTLDEYDEVLTQSTDAVDELYEDMLIGVTEFYRDAKAMKALREEVLDKLALQDPSGPPLKIWVPACASGEEVYSIAIEVSEALRAQGSDRRFRIIGTDIHAKSVEIASRGLYSEEKIKNVPQELRDRYFLYSNGQYLIDPTLRQKIIFSVHNLISDPPFMNLDLISCRNLLIYLREEPQASVISMFLFGLQQHGHLLLGASESVGKFSTVFEVVNARWRIFKKVSGGSKLGRSLLASRRSSLLSSDVMGSDFSDRVEGRKPLVAEVTEVRSREVLIRSYDALLKRFAPSAILLTVDGKVLNWFGDASEFIDTMNNLADWTVQEIVHPDLHFAINVGIEKLRQGHFETHSRKVTVTLPGQEPRNCRVEIEALDDEVGSRLILAKIELERSSDVVDADVIQAVPEAVSEDDTSVLTRRIHYLERDLRLTEETLQHVTERLEASGEELQASNEELQASNEELQASNEELQSSNEELHAVNEELVSVSAEHERKIEQLSELNANTEIVLKMLNTGVIVLDQHTKIHRFSQLIERDFLLQEHDVGRAISTVGPRLDFVDLEEMAEIARGDPTPQMHTGQHAGRELCVEARRIFLGPKGEEAPGTIVLFRWS
ncbi:CheR family methyltransferase [Gymnodinialimonas sp. 2305UL16-5]|uniref:CheR family methyltransferase n=1 Tax=Gymnodinialimonas mytili TaxID=3126503 RepID=UPI0030A886D8